MPRNVRTAWILLHCSRAQPSGLDKEISSACADSDSADGRRQLDKHRQIRQLMRIGDADPQTASFNSFAALNAIFLLAAISIGAPVPGFLPLRAGRDRTSSIPRPVSLILSPFFRCSVASITRPLSVASACFFGTSWLSANCAAICLSVMVAGAEPFLAAWD